MNMNFILARCHEPQKGDIVFQFTEGRKAMFPCKIIDGQYLDSKYHRLSNFWTWENLLTGDIENGYGGFYEIVEIHEPGELFAKESGDALRFEPHKKCEEFNKDKAIRPHYGESFHGESWYNCPVCGKAFEFYSAFFNKNRCPHCGQLFDLK